MAEEEKEISSTSENDKNTSDNGNGKVKDPIPLALEGGTVQLELEVKPKAQDKKTQVSFKDKNYIKNLIATPKEGPNDGETPTSSTTGAKGTSVPKEEIKAIQDRLSKEQETYEAEPPSIEECEDTADFFIELADTILTIILQWYAKDSNDKDYQIEEHKKKKLKKSLSKILIRMNKKYPLGMMFIMMILAVSAPLVRKAHLHRKMVDEKKAEQKANVVSDTVVRKRRSRKNDSDDNIPFTEAVEVR